MIRDAGGFVMRNHMSTETVQHPIGTYSMKILGCFLLGIRDSTNRLFQTSIYPLEIPICIHLSAGRCHDMSLLNLIFDTAKWSQRIEWFAINERRPPLYRKVASDSIIQSNHGDLCRSTKNQWLKNHSKPTKHQIGSTNPQVSEHICFKHLVTNHLT